jgi:radical SAM-linked protein
MTRAPKVRLRFAKRGDLRLVSHHDLLRCLERMLRRAAVPVAFSQGFNPRPRITFALALGLGMEACDEIVDLELSEPWDAPALLDRLRSVAPQGFVWLGATALPPDAPPPHPRSVEYQLPVAAARQQQARDALAGFLASASWPMIRRRPDREQTFDLRPHVLSVELTHDGDLRFRLAVAPDGSARPEEVLEALRLRDLLDSGAVLTRTNVEIEM